MASSASTQKPLTIQQEVDAKLRSKKIAAMVQTQNEVTPLPADQETAFRAWLQKYAVKDLDTPDSHYDYRGAFLADAKPDKAGHWPDTWKQHGHPTFSTESQYSAGPQDGGKWVSGRFVPAGQDSGPVPPAKKATALTDFGPAPFNADTNALTDFLNVAPPGHALEDFGPPPTVTSRDPITDTITQHPDFPIPLIPGSRGGEFTDVVYGAAALARDALVGGTNLLLGGASAPIPVVSDEEAKAARARGQIVQTDAEVKQHRIAVAFVASELAGAAAAVTILRGLAPLAKTVLKGSAAGAAFGALRPHEGDESVLGAMAVDALFFGGLSLTGGLIGKITKPLTIGVDELEKAGIKVHAEALRGREYGKSLFEEIQSVADDLQPETFAEGVPRTATTPLDPTTLPSVTRAHAPDNIAPLRRILGSPSLWGETQGVVGDAAERIVTNFRSRAALARRVYAEWDATLNEAGHVLFADRFTLPAQRQFEREEFGKLLDTIFTGEDLPLGTPAHYVHAFTLLRDRLLADREIFRLQRGAGPDYGINEYLPHVWVGDLSIVDANTNAILRPGVKWGELRQVVGQVIAEHPDAKPMVQPRSWILPTDIAQFGISGKDVAPFIERASAALSLSPAELTQLMTENRLLRVKTPGERFFGHTQPRSANLPGYVTDPFKALRLYASGAARNMAFFDARPKVEPILRTLAEFRGTAPSVSALRGYVDAVLGVPSPAEELVREVVKDWARRAAKPFGPGAQQVAEDLGEGLQNTGRTALSLVTKAEALVRLGYNPMSWLVQLTQTVVNTSSAIGYGPTIRGLRLLYDANQQAQVDALLRAGNIKLLVPLAEGDAILKRNVGVSSPFSPLYLFNSADTGNSAVAFLAKYQERIAAGVDAGEALAEAVKFRTTTNFDYSTADAPRLLRGQLGSTLFQFKKFFIKETEFFNRLSVAGKARFSANVVALFGVSGLFTLPPFALLNWATGQLTGETIVERAQRAFPRASRGLPGFAGFDMGGAGSIGTPREISDVFGPGILDLWTATHDLAAPWVLDLIKGKGGNLSPSDRARAIAELLPTVARRLLDAHDIYATGQVHVRGTHIPKLVPANPGLEAFMAAFGVKSLEASEEQRYWNTLQRRSKIYEDERGALLQEIVNAHFDNNDRRMAELLQWGAHQDPPLIIYNQEIVRAIAKTVVPRTFRGALQGPAVLKPEQLQGLPPFLLPR